jgi:hypothetical protein
MLIQHRQHFVRVFRGQQDDVSALNMRDADHKIDDDDEDTVVRDAEESDYGSDLDDATLDALLTSVSSPEPEPSVPTVKTEDAEEEPLLPERAERDDDNETYTVVLSRADIEAIQRIRAKLPELIGHVDRPATPGQPSAKDSRLDQAGPCSTSTASACHESGLTR